MTEHPDDLGEDEVLLRNTLVQRSQKCPPFDVLRAVGQDVLPADVEKAAVEHLRACRLCSGLMTDFASLPEAPMTAAEEARITAMLPPRRAVAGRPHILRPAMAIAACLLLGVGGLLLWQRTHQAPTTNGGAAHIESASPSAQAPAAVAELQLPLTPLAPPEDTALLTRGGSHNEPSTEELLPAFAAYNRGSFNEAAGLFAKLATSYPRSVIVSLYGGVSELKAGQDREAANHLETAEKLASGKQREAALWYRAVAASRLKEPGAAASLEKLCQSNPATYTTQSCTAIHGQP